jgi:hypothetical protein
VSAAALLIASLVELNEHQADVVKTVVFVMGTANAAEHIGKALLEKATTRNRPAAGDSAERPAGPEAQQSAQQADGGNH